jgi:hypothetical protein
MGARRDHCRDQDRRLEDGIDESGGVTFGRGEAEGDRGQNQPEDESEPIVDPVHARIIARGEDATSRSRLVKRLSRSAVADRDAGPA